MSDPVEKSVAKAGEIADLPTEDDIKAFGLKNKNGEKRGYLIHWKTSIGAYLMAEEDSHISLDKRL